MNDLTLTERRNEILELLHNGGKVRVADLAVRFNVSEVSIRNDLAELESEGLLSRVHGGAIGSYDSYYNMSLAQRSNTNRREKEEIAAQIADQIHDNQTIMMNAGTTTLAVMQKLMNKKRLTVVTNSIVLALEGSKSPNIRMVLLGGDVNSEYQFVYGAQTVKELAGYYADKLILSADGIDLESGVTTYYDQEAEICSMMTEHAKEVITALDYTKIGRVAFKKICDVAQINSLVTNQNAEKTVMGDLKKCGINVIFPKRELK